MGWAEDEGYDGYDGWEDIGGERKKPVVCRNCKAGKLHWVEVTEMSKGVEIGKRWRLYDAKDNPHFCMKIKGMTIK